MVNSMLFKSFPATIVLLLPLTTLVWESRQHKLLLFPMMQLVTEELLMFMIHGGTVPVASVNSADKTQNKGFETKITKVTSWTKQHMSIHGWMELRIWFTWRTSPNHNNPVTHEAQKKPNTFPTEDTLPGLFADLNSGVNQNHGQTGFAYQFTKPEVCRELKLVSPLKVVDPQEPEELIL